MLPPTITIDGLDPSVSLAAVTNFPVSQDGKTVRMNVHDIRRYVTPEAFHQPLVHGTNYQPAIQQAIDYAIDNGIPEVRLSGVYDCWATTRTTTIYQGADDGHLLVIRGSIAIVGEGSGVVINRKNRTGGDPFIQQELGDTHGNGDEGYWRGGGIHLTSLGGINADSVVILKNFKLDGGLDIGAPAGAIQPTEEGDGWDVTDKGFWLQDTRCGLVYMEDMEICRFRGELNYWGAISDSTSLSVQN